MTKQGRIIALALTLAVVAGGGAGCRRDLSGPSTTSPTLAGDGPLEVSGAGVGTQPFGTDADEVVAALTARFGEPDRAVGPLRYVRIRGSDRWFETAGDPLSPSWRYPVAAETCWDALCLVLGGDDADTLRLRGWVLAEPGFAMPADPPRPDVRLAGTGLRLGDTWTRLHAAYPDTVVHGAEGASLAVVDTPWPGFTDGAAAWRLSGTWDYRHPTRAPAGAVVIRLSGGEGPEPGCC